MTYSKGAHAVVIGAGISGLCAARALGSHFERITLLERDPLSTQIAHRHGVPQSHHVSALLLRGLLELERLFPGIERELTEAGASRVDLGTEVAHCTEWGWAPRASNIGVAPLAMSRLLIESVIRARVRREVKNLTLLERTRVTGLLSARHGERLLVTGVSIDSEPSELTADLVVDASGRQSKCLEWFSRLEVGPPPETLVDAKGGYASRFYKLAPSPSRWWRGMVIDPKPPTFGRWGLIMPVEHGVSILTVSGVNQDYPPSNEVGFAAYLNSLRSPDLAREIARATPLSEIRTHRALSNRARRFDKWQHQIGGFMAIGDSAVAFNAAHGQGMSMAAVSANVLGEVVADSARMDKYSLSRSFHTAQWRALENAWLLATGSDFLWPGTAGKRPFGFALTRALATLIVRAAHDDPALKRMIGPVYQLIEEPNALLMQPSFLARVSLAALRRGVGQGLELAAPSELAGCLDDLRAPLASE
jgi:2-polyprenyl-6-methoxyphenol hydroxylase-like FAD-dependent oxidoreductase